MPVIRTSKFILRDIKKEDALDLFFIGSSFDNTRYLTWGPFLEPSEASIMLERFYFNRLYLGLPVGYAIEDTKTHEMIGLIEYHTYFPATNSAELGFVLRSDYHKKGIMTRALGIMIELGFTHLGLDKLIVGHVDLNEDCKKLILKHNFKYEHTNFSAFKTKDTNEYRNILYYSLYKEEYEGS